MAAIELNDAALAEYESAGYITVPQLISAEEVAAAREALRDVMLTMLADAKAGRAEYLPPREGKTGNYDGARIKRPGMQTELLFEHSFDPMSAVPADTVMRVRNFYHYESEHTFFRQLVASPRIQGVAAKLLGEEAVLFQTMALLKPALIGSEKPWHQDNAYSMYAPLDKVVGFWLALDDAAAENGCMHVLPGWHRRGAFRHIHAGDCQIMPERLQKSQAVPVELPTGGAMFFSGMLPHQTPPNRSPKPRWAIQFHYRGASTRMVEQAEYDRLFAEADGTPASCTAAE